MEQIVVRSLPVGTMAALRTRAERHHRSVEAAARAIIAEALEREPMRINDLLSMDEGAEIDFEPQPLHLKTRNSEL